MPTAARLLFGVRTSETISLIVAVEGTLPPQPPDLRITTGGQEVMVSCSNNAWKASLSRGDHIICLPSPDDSWLDPVTFTLGAPATIVIRDASTSSTLIAWTVTEGTVRDPKKPWPPPLVDSLQSPPLADSTWLCTMLTALTDEMSRSRSASEHQPAARATKPGVFR